MLNDCQVLGLGVELLVRVLTRATHHGVRHLLSLHLLGNLAGSVVATQEKDVDELETKDAEKVPTDARHPSRIHISGLNTSLQHALKLDGDREGQFHDNITAEKGIDPAHNKRVGNNHGKVILHHSHHSIHGTRISKRVGGRLTLAIGILEVASGLEARDESVATGLKGLLGKDVMVVSQGDTSGEGTLLAHGLAILLLRNIGKKDGGVMSENTGEDHDDGDGCEDPVKQLGIPMKGLHRYVNHC